MAFLLDSLKEKFGSSGEEDGFPDMNYYVGNTSGMDVGNVPSPLDRRIGRMAQLGGELMEIQISNPATFQILSEELISTVNSLEMDMTLHSDPGKGFTQSYMTHHSVQHRYLKGYFEQLAVFQKRARESADFDIGRLNIHASVSSIPQGRGRPQDDAVDPFGNEVSEVFESNGANIYENRAFLEKLWTWALKPELDRRYRFYAQIFVDHSDEFRKRWQKAQREIMDEIYANQETLNKAYLVQAAARVEGQANLKYSQLLSEVELEEPIQIEEEALQARLGEEIETLEDLTQLPPMQPLAQASGVVNAISNIDDLDQLEIDKQLVVDSIENLMDRFWSAEPQDGLSIEAKTKALVRHNDLQEHDIYKMAQERIEEEEIDLKAVTGDEGFYNNLEDSEGRKKHLKIWDQLLNGTRKGQELNREYDMFIYLVPLWMMVAEEDHGSQDGFSEPGFIWEAVVEQEWGEIDSHDDYESKLTNREFRLDVIAASAACYIWGHFTQIRDSFQMEELDVSGEYTWIEWIHETDLPGVNIESINKSTIRGGELARIWRPKDIAVACRAINMTARKEFGDLRGDQLPAKFTIDMEHTASFGVDPWKEMEQLIEQERGLAKNGYVDTDPDKPLADIVKMYHITKPGFERRGGTHRHGGFAKGDVQLYEWLYRMVEAGFARNPEDRAIVMFEVGGEYYEDIYTISVALDLIQLGVKPGDLDPEKVPVDGNYENRKQGLMARFFGMDDANKDREWAKIEEHAFDPLKGLLEAEEFDYTWSSKAAMENENRPGEFKKEEYQ